MKAILTLIVPTIAVIEFGRLSVARLILCRRVRFYGDAFVISGLLYLRYNLRNNYDISKIKIYTQIKMFSNSGCVALLKAKRDCSINFMSAPLTMSAIKAEQIGFFNLSHFSIVPYIS